MITAIELPLWVAVALPVAGAATALLITRPRATRHTDTANVVSVAAPIVVTAPPTAAGEPWPTPLSPRLHERTERIQLPAAVWTPAADTTTWPVWDAINAEPDVWLRWTGADYLLAAAVPAVAAATWAVRAGTYVWLAAHEPAFRAGTPAVVVGRHRAGGHHAEPVAAVPVDDLDARAASLIAEETARRDLEVEAHLKALLTVTVGARR